MVVAALVTRRNRRHGTPGVTAADVRAGYALEEMRVGIVVASLASLLVVLAVLLVLVSAFMARVTGLPPSISRPTDLIQGLTSPAEPTPPAPRLQAEPGVDQEAYQASEQADLQSYRWVDRNAGVVGIPIDRAMDLTIQRGLPGARHARPNARRATRPLPIHLQLGPSRRGVAMRTTIAALTLLALAFASVGTAQAQSQSLTASQLSMVRFDQQLGATVPANLPFYDENGQPVTLGDYLGQRQAVLTLNYFHCQNLCPIELDGVIDSLNGVPLTLGQDFTMLTVSIDPREGPSDAADAKARAIRGYDRAEDAAGWHVLTGAQPSIDALTDAVGFRYAYDAQADDFAHPAGVIVLTADGHVSRYLYGFDFAATDLRLALVEAGQQRIGSLADRALLVCYHYDPLTGRYTLLALDLMRIAGVVGALGLAGFVGFLWREERRRGPPAPKAS